jgi:hypothetical protein
MVNNILTDQYFLDNNYWTIGEENVLESTEKWRKLSDTCLRQSTIIDNENQLINIIKPEQIINNIYGVTKRTKNYYYRKKKK